MSAVRCGGLYALNAIHMLLPVAAVEAYGLYLSALAGLRGCVSVKNMAKVYAVFLLGAVVEACLMPSA